jgi:RHS repeat-associated protein
LPSFRDQASEITSVPDGAEFYLADAQQSPLAITNKAANVISRTALHPFGHVRFQAGKSGDPWGFVGNEEDRGSGISDFHARPYRPELGVFLAVDPIALLSPDQTIGTPIRLFAYAYAGSDPISQSDTNGLTFGQFVRGMWDQGVDDVKAAAHATVASVRSNVALAMSGDIEGAAAHVVVGAAHGMIQTVKDVGNFGDNFAKAVFAPNDYESGRLAVKPVMTAMNAAALVMGTRLGTPKASVSKVAQAERTASRGAAGDTVQWHHGSLDAPKLRKEGFSTLDRYGKDRGAPYACVSTQRCAASEAINPAARYDAAFADSNKMGIVEGRMSRAEWDKLHADGHLVTNNSYQGFGGGIRSTETKAATADGVHALNRSMER